MPPPITSRYPASTRPSESVSSPEVVRSGRASTPGEQAGAHEGCAVVGAAEPRTRVTGAPFFAVVGAAVPESAEDAGRASVGGGAADPGRNASGANTWSTVTAALLVETRIVHDVEVGSWLCGPACPTGSQLNIDCGLSPTNGVNAWFASEDGKAARPVRSAIAGEGALPRSQCAVGDHDGVDGDVPSHCSTYTSAPGANPVATTVTAEVYAPPVTETATTGVAGWTTVAPDALRGVASTTAAMHADATRSAAVPRLLTAYEVGAGRTRSRRPGSRHTSL